LKITLSLVKNKSKTEKYVGKMEEKIHSQLKKKNSLEVPFSDLDEPTVDGTESGKWG